MTFLGPFFRTLFILLVLHGVGAHAARADAKDDQARALFEAGIAASRQARWAEALQLFESSRSLVEKPSTLLNLAIAQVNLGQARDALKVLDHLAEVADRTAHAAILERAKSLRAEAYEAASNAARQELLIPSLPDGEAKTQLDLAVVAYIEGRYDEALSAFERASNLCDDPELWYDAGITAERLHADARALFAFEAFVAARPESPRARALRPRLDELRRVVRGQPPKAEAANLPAASTEQPGSSSAVQVSMPPVESPPALTVPRWLLISGAVSSLATGATSIWLADRIYAAQRCERRPLECTNSDVVERQRAAALTSTLLLGVTSVALVVSGAILLSQRRSLTPKKERWIGANAAGLTLRW